MQSKTICYVNFSSLHMAISPTCSKSQEPAMV